MTEETRRPDAVPDDASPPGKPDDYAAAGDALGKVEPAADPRHQVRPVDRFEQPDHNSQNVDSGLSFVASLLSRQPFYDYFVHVALRRYGGDDREQRVNQLANDNVRFYRFCLASDVVLRWASLGLIFFAAAGLVWDAVWQ